MENLLDEAIIIISANGYDDGKINGLKPSTATFLDIPYTRGSAATKTNEQRVIVPSEGVNVPRLDFSDGEAKWVVEYQSTNRMNFTNDFSNSVWTKINLALTQNYGISPGGNQDSTLITITGDGYIIRNMAQNIIETASLYVKGVAGEIIYFGKGANIGQGKSFTFNGDWQRLIQTTSNSGNNFLLSNAQASSNAQVFEIWEAQLENLPFATSVMPTDGTTFTRLKDNPESLPIASTVTGAIVRDNYIQNYAGNTPSLLTMKSNTNRIIIYGRQILASEITCAGLTETVFMLDIKATKEFQITVSGTGVVYWGDGESDVYDGTQVVLTHTFFKVGSIVAFIGTLTAFSSITTDVNSFILLESLPNSLVIYRNYGINTSSGDIGNLPSNITTYDNSGLNTSYGDIGNLPSGITVYNNIGLNEVNQYTSGHVFSSAIIFFRNLPKAGFGLTSAMVDNLLIDLESSEMSSGTITLNGNNEARTSASDAAVTSLQSKGVTVQTT